MSENLNQKMHELSWNELNELLDQLIEDGENYPETKKWYAAHAEWERRTGESDD